MNWRRKCPVYREKKEGGKELKNYPFRKKRRTLVFLIKRLFNFASENKKHHEYRQT
jgi:hypothetical protein